MSVRPSIKTFDCPTGTWTNLWNAPSIGYMKLFVESDVEIRWDRANEHPFWYWQDGAQLFTGWNQINFSPPSAFTIFRVRPTRRVTISISEFG